MRYLGTYSRFSNTGTALYNGELTYKPWVSYNFLTTRPDETNIKVFQVTSALEGRPDIISTTVYGVPDLFWVLIAFNRPRDVLNWPKAGDVIEYPDDSIVIPELQSDVR